MKNVKIIAGLIWAFSGLFLIIILFPGLNGFSESLAKLPFMKINPRYSGGEVVKQIAGKSCTLDIRRPVFDGFFKERNSGFVQIDWRGNLPEMIKDTIDYDCDGIRDFCISINRKESGTVLEPFSSKVQGVVLSTPASYGWTVRVGLRK